MQNPEWSTPLPNTTTFQQMYGQQFDPSQLTSQQLEQWQQWQEQFQCWQQQYGAKYEESLRAAPNPVPPPLPSQPPPPTQQQTSDSQRPPLPPEEVKPPPPAKDKLVEKEELSEAEKNFDVQFKQWEQQFETWKAENVAHPDKVQYREYEKKWESWREQLLQRREQMRKKRLATKQEATPPIPEPKPPSGPPPEPAPPPNPYNEEPLQFKTNPGRVEKPPVDEHRPSQTFEKAEDDSNSSTPIFALSGNKPINTMKKMQRGVDDSRDSNKSGLNITAALNNANCLDMGPNMMPGGFGVMNNGNFGNNFGMGPNMMPGGFGPNGGNFAMGPNMIPDGFGPSSGNFCNNFGMGPNMMTGGMGPNMMPGGMGPNMMTGGMGPNMMPGGMGPNMMPGGMGPNMMPGGMGPNMIPSGIGPNMMPGGFGPNNGNNFGMGPNMAPGNFGPNNENFGGNFGMNPNRMPGGFGPNNSNNFGMDPNMPQNNMNFGMGRGNMNQGPGIEGDRGSPRSRSPPFDERRNVDMDRFPRNNQIDDRLRLLPDNDMRMGGPDDRSRSPGDVPRRFENDRFSRNNKIDDRSLPNVGNIRNSGNHNRRSPLQDRGPDLFNRSSLMNLRGNAGGTDDRFRGRSPDEKLRSPASSNRPGNLDRLGDRGGFLNEEEFRDARPLPGLMDLNVDIKRPLFDKKWEKYEKDDCYEDPFEEKEEEADDVRPRGGHWEGDNLRDGFRDRDDFYDNNRNYDDFDADIRNRENFQSNFRDNYNEPKGSFRDVNRDFSKDISIDELGDRSIPDNIRDSKLRGPRGPVNIRDRDYRGNGPRDPFPERDRDFRQENSFLNDKDCRVSRGDDSRGPNSIAFLQNNRDLPFLGSEEPPHATALRGFPPLNDHGPPPNQKQLSGFVGDILAKLGVASAVPSDEKEKSGPRVSGNGPPHGTRETSSHTVPPPHLSDKPPLVGQPPRAAPRFPVKTAPRVSLPHGPSCPPDNLRSLPEDNTRDPPHPATFGSRFDPRPPSREWAPEVIDYANKSRFEKDLTFQVKDYGHGADRQKTFDYGHGNVNTGSTVKTFDYGHGGPAPEVKTFDYGHGGVAPEVKTFDYGHGGSAAPEMKTFDYGHGGPAPEVKTFDYGHGGPVPEPKTFDYGHGGPAPEVKTFDYGHGGSTSKVKTFDHGHSELFKEAAHDTYDHKETGAHKEVIDYGHASHEETGAEYKRDRSRSPVRTGRLWARDKFGTVESSREFGESPARRSSPVRERARDKEREFASGRDRETNRDGTGNVREGPGRDSNRDRDGGRHNTRDVNRERDWDRDMGRRYERDRDRSARDRNRSPNNSRRSRSPRRPFRKDQGKEDNKKPDEVKLVTVEESEGEVTQVLVEDVLILPRRRTRPPKIVIMLRGLPGSGKSHVARLIKEKEVEQGGAAPRVLSIDDYFMTEVEEDRPDSVKTKVMKYEYDKTMETTYQAALVKAFKKTVLDGFFSFIIVDSVNHLLQDIEAMWSFAKKSGFQVYIAEMDNDVSACKRRTKKDVAVLAAKWEVTPRHYLRLDVRSLLQAEAIEEVEMEDVQEGDNNENPAGPDKEEDEPPVTTFLKSKWDDLENSDQKLDRLDGLKKKKPAESMEEYLNLDEFVSITSSSAPGKKRVRWADIEERREQEKMRAIGFVVGQTDWKRMMDPSMGESALIRTKYI